MRWCTEWSGYGVESVFQRTFAGLPRDKEWRKAAQTVKDYDGWLTERTEMEELAERVEEIEELYEKRRGGGISATNGRGRP